MWPFKHLYERTYIHISFFCVSFNFISRLRVVCLCFTVYNMREDPESPGLGENQDTAVKNGDEVPEADVDLSDDDPPVLKRMKELIIKMTSHHASDRPSAEDVVSKLKELYTQVYSSQPKDDVDPPLRLLQALNDKSQTAMADSIAAPDATSWINNRVDPKRLDHPNMNVDNLEPVTCLTFASHINEVLTVCQLVEAGCDVTVRDLHGQTPLHKACHSDVDANSKVVFLLQCDASLVNATDYMNHAPLHYAVFAGKRNVFNTLLDNGADVNVQGRQGRTALHVACIKGDIACIHELMACGAHIEARDSDCGATPLHLAAAFNHPEIVKTLVDVYKASINVFDENENSVLNAAAFNGNVEVVKILLSFDKCDVNAGQ